MQIFLPNVAHVRPLGYKLLSLQRMADRGHKYVGEEKGVTLHPKNGKTLFGRSVEKLTYLSGFRRPLDSSNCALAAIAPGNIPSVSPVDINTFHTSHGHIHEKLLCSTAKQLEVVLEGSLRDCEVCSVAKGLSNRSAGQLQQGNSKKILQNSVGGTTSVRGSHPLIVQNSSG